MHLPTLDLDAEANCSVASLAGAVAELRPGTYTEFVETSAKSLELATPRLMEWADQVRREGVGLVRGLPIDMPLPPTPSDLPAPPTPIGDGVIGMLSSLFGQIFTIGEKNDPKHIHDVFFISRNAETQLGSGRQRLEWHVEDGCHSMRANWVILSCLRGAPDATTYFARAVDFRLEPAEHRLLCGTDIPLQLDESFAEARAKEYTVRTLEVRPDGGYDIVFDPAFTIRGSADVEGCLTLVEREAARVASGVTLGPGDAVVFNNRTVMHARTSYKPVLDGTGRWLKRALVTDSSVTTRCLENGAAPLD